MRLKLTLEYDGTAFRGWAAQPGLRTVEGVLQEALQRVFPRWGELAVAGRTDTGVHALGQVASLEVEGGPPPERAAEALNAELSDDVCVAAAAPSAPEFHARHSALARSYRYRVYHRLARSPFETRRSWWFPRPLDEERLAESADLLVGEHDRENGRESRQRAVDQADHRGLDSLQQEGLAVRHRLEFSE